MRTAIAHSNIALVKYWGKRDRRLNLPAAGSLSLTLGALTTTTTVSRSDRDAVIINGAPARDDVTTRLVSFLDLVAGQNSRPALRIETCNDFPTAAGLASSASGFAALTLAASAELDQSLSETDLSILARRGSGSAARSISGGWVKMDAGTAADGSDAFAHAIAPVEHWDLRCVVLVTTEGEKGVSSTVGMDQTALTSPYYDAWVHSVDADLVEAEQAILQRDFEKLAVTAERSCMRMHASAIAADPAVLYWNGATVELIHRVRALRNAGQPAFFTIDAGPHVKVFCAPDTIEAVLDAAQDMIVDSIISAPGGPAKLTETR